MGEQNSEVWSDTDRDGTVDTLVDQPTTFDVVNTYAVIVGRSEERRGGTAWSGARSPKGEVTKVSDTGAQG